MSFDDDLRERFAQLNPDVTNIDDGAAGVERSTRRRTAVGRSIGAGAALMILLVGYFGITTLGEDSPTLIFTDPAPTTIPNETSVDEPDDAPTVPVGGSTGIATVDIDGVVRINDEIVDADTWLPILTEQAAQPSVGPDEQVLTTDDTGDCPLVSIVDVQGNPVYSHPVSALSRCIPGELADWSTSGHVVLVSPTAQDAWSILVLAANGDSAQLTSPGAFQPMQLDVHTGADGRTQVLVLGSGEELVYIDVDAFLNESVPELAVFGMANEANLVSAQFVDGVGPHPFRALIDAWIDDHYEGVLGEDEPQFDESTGEHTAIEPQHVSAVTGVASNDTLNARSGPGTESEVVLEFQHDATGLVHTGNDATADDGARWVEIYAPTTGEEVSTAWVNSAFLTSTSVTDAQPCLFNGPQDHYIGIDWTNTEGSTDSTAAVVSNIETYRFGSCIRTVFEFSDGWSYQDGGANRVATLPNDIVVTRNNPPTIDFGASITGAEAVLARFAERGGVSQSTFVSLARGFRLDGVLYAPTSTMWVVFDNRNGRMTIDIADIRLSPDADPALIERVGAKKMPIVDRDELIVTSASHTPDERSWTFTGMARPFEANLGVAVRTTNGQPVVVEWVNGVVDGARAENGVMTTTWTAALGWFSFTIVLPEGVDPRIVLVEFDPSGGAADDPEIITLALADLSR